MSHTAAHDTQGVLIHGSRAYDILFSRFIRRTDTPILDLAEVSPGDSVLDVGTGPGYLARAAAERVGPAGRAVGLDASPEMVSRATELAARESSTATFVKAGAQHMQFDDSTFDVVVSRLAMHHLPGDIKDLSLAEMARVLKPGGRLVLADVAAHSLAGMLHGFVRRVHGAPREESNPLAELVRRAGFEGVTTGPVGMLMYVSGRATRSESTS